MTDDGTGPGPSVGRSIYGFTLMIFCILCNIAYVLWLFLPAAWLEDHGLSYFSSKHYALAIPVYFCTLLFVFASVIYPAVNLTLTEPITSLNTIVDSHSREDPSKFECENPSSECIPPIYDLNIEDVNYMLYSERDEHASVL